MLSLVDGTTSLQDIIDLSGMPADEARQVLSGLLERRVITAR
jgi:DNA-nicking Smr family endonuclease